MLNFREIIAPPPELLMNLLPAKINHKKPWILHFKLFICLAGLALGYCHANDKLKPDDLQGWKSESFNLAWPAWQHSCAAFRKQNQPVWTKLCDKSDRINSKNGHQQKQFFEDNFSLVALTNQDGSVDGTITGYYEPILKASMHADDVYRYPVYSKPTQTAINTLSRKQIESSPQHFQDNIIAWVKSRYDLFFLHIQGSGRIRLKEGGEKSIVYAGNNGHEYTSIGNVLIGMGEMKKEDVSMQSLKQWLLDNPDKAAAVMQRNQRYIFFKLTQPPVNVSGPRGSLNVPLTPLRSIAIDPDKVTMGSPIWLATSLPGEDDHSTPFNHLVFAQDTGAAIKGRVRADVFFGNNAQAQNLAGHMNQSGRMYILTPK